MAAEDINAQQVEALTASLNKIAGPLGKMVEKGNSMSRKDASETLESELKTRKKTTKVIAESNDKVTRWSRGMRDATSSTDRFAEKMEGAVGAMAKWIPAGFVFQELFRYGRETTDTYKSLTKYGQSFGGSMMNMSVAAANAGLPLDQFARAIEKNSPVVAHMGQGFFAVSKQMRDLTLKSGLYGMSISEMTDFAGSYLETQRVQGGLTNRNNKATAKFIADLALNATALASLTGKAREQIMEDAQRLMRDPQLAAAMFVNAAQGASQYNDNIQKAILGLSAQWGEGGKIVADGLAETIASFNNAAMSPTVQKLIQGGAAQAAQAFQTAADSLAAGVDGEQVQLELVNQIKDMDTPELRQQLQMLAMAGDENAKSVLKMLMDTKRVTKAQMEQAKAERENMDMLTGFFASLEHMFAVFKGSFIKGFLAPFSKAFGSTSWADGLKGMEESFEKLKPTFERIGESWGNFVQKFLNEDNMENVGAFIKDAFGMLASVAKFLLEFGPPLISAIGFIADGFTTILGTVKNLTGFMGKEGSNIVTGLTALGLWFGGGALIKMVGGMIGGGIKGLFANLFGQKNDTVNIRAGQVFVNGGAGGGPADMLDDLGGGGGGDRGGRGGRTRGQRRAMARAARRGAVARGGGKLGKMGMMGNALARMVGRGAANKAGAKIGARAAGKSLLKKIPGVGWVPAALFAGGRALSGDWAGAGMEVASGVAGSIPGIGTAASLGIDAALAARDMQGGNARPRGPGLKMPSLGGLGKAGLIVGGLGAAGAAGMAAANWLSPDQPDNGQLDDLAKQRLQAEADQKRLLEQLLAEQRKTNQLLSQHTDIATSQVRQLAENARATRQNASAAKDNARS